MCAKKQKNHGFTLIEMVIVLLILAILAAFSIPSYLGYLENTKTTMDKVSLGSLNAATTYYRIPKTITNNDIFDGFSTDEARMQELISKGCLDELLIPKQKDIKFTWNIESQKWIASGVSIALSYTADQYFVLQKVLGVPMGMTNNYLTTGGVNVVIPPTIAGITLTEIGRNSFKEKSLQSVIIPEGITVIDTGAFSRNSLTKINIPASVTQIAGGAFQYNPLTEITIGAGIIFDYTSFGTKPEPIKIPPYDYGFMTLYNSPAGGAGTYKFNSTTQTWIKQ
ncbi:MAG: leucine-rich repeat protein [Clostridia bacterium]